ncbi:hypothetical protein EJB05_48235, partial [Eragrostis curvula]
HEDDLNSGRWEARFARALRYYAAAFDAVDAAGLADASPARAKAAEMVGAGDLRNAVVFEGANLFERHETFAGWRRRMEDCGFRNAGIGDQGGDGRMFAPGNYNVQAQGDGEFLTLLWSLRPYHSVPAPVFGGAVHTWAAAPLNLHMPGPTEKKGSQAGQPGAPHLQLQMHTIDEILPTRRLSF